MALSILFSAEEIDRRISEMAAAIYSDFKDSTDLVVVTITKGSIIFTADLVRKIPLKMTLELVSAKSYRQGRTDAGELNVCMSLDPSAITGRDVLLVDDIADSGVTMTSIAKMLSSHSPRSLKTCALLDKPSRRKVRLDVDYKGFDIPDRFVVGFGMDSTDGTMWNLPYIAVVE